MLKQTFHRCGWDRQSSILQRLLRQNSSFLWIVLNCFAFLNRSRLIDRVWKTNKVWCSLERKCFQFSYKIFLYQVRRRIFASIKNKHQIWSINISDCISEAFSQVLMTRVTTAKILTKMKITFGFFAIWTIFYFHQLNPI